MSKVSTILSEKSYTVHHIGPGASVLEAAERMNEHRIGSLVVMDNEQVVGILTERDVLTRVVAARRDPATTRVRDVMTSEVACCTPDTSIDEARAVMRNRRIRHLPVVDDAGKLHGLISIGDLNAFRLDGQEVTIHFMRQYIYGNT